MLLRLGLILAALGAGLYIVLTHPAKISDARLAALPAAQTDAGREIFVASGCASCHYAPGAEGEAQLVLAGGQRFPSPFGTFLAPNISPHGEAGIGGWSEAEFITAILEGTSPEGRHYFPAFPYSSYARMQLEDARALWAYMQTLPADATPSQDHEVSFPFNIRRNLGVWKWLYVSRDWVAEAPSPELTRGRYLVEALGHCAECHTPRDALGGLDTTRWMAGAPDPSGKGKVPDLRPAALGWSAEDIAYYLETGFTPDFDSAGGHMVQVIANTAQLSPEDRQAIAAYLLALPAG